MTQTTIILEVLTLLDHVLKSVNLRQTASISFMVTALEKANGAIMRKLQMQLVKMEINGIMIITTSMSWFKIALYYPLNILSYMTMIIERLFISFSAIKESFAMLNIR